MPAEDVARLGKDVRGRSQVTGHDKKAVKLIMTRKCMVSGLVLMARESDMFDTEHLHQQHHPERPADGSATARTLQPV